MRRIHTDFPHHASLVLERLHTLHGLVSGSRQDSERILGAVIIHATGRLDRLDDALELARLDWRDLLVAADLADEAWPLRLSEWLNPYESPPEVISPTTTGELVDADGHRWILRRRRIDLRIVRRLLHRTDVVVMLSESAGLQPRLIPAHERPPVWETVRRAYAGPGGPDQIIDGSEYLGYEFADNDGTTLLYLEQHS